MHRIALHCIGIAHCNALHCIGLHGTEWHRIALHQIAWHRIAGHRITLHCIASDCMTSPRIASHCIGLHASEGGGLPLTRHNEWLNVTYVRYEQPLTLTLSQLQSFQSTIVSISPFCLVHKIPQPQVVNSTGVRPTRGVAQGHMHTARNGFQAGREACMWKRLDQGSTYATHMTRNRFPSEQFQFIIPSTYFEVDNNSKATLHITWVSLQEA